MSSELSRRDLIHRATVLSVAAATAGAASSGTVAADDDGILPDPSPRHVFINPGIEALYNYVRGYGDDGYTEESVHEMSAENIHSRIWQGTDATLRELEGATTSLENYMDAGDPVASPLAELAYSTLRTKALQAVQDGESPTDARIEAENEALDELSVPATNVVRQWNEHVFNFVSYLLTFADNEPEWESVDYDAGDDLHQFEPVELITDGSDGLPVLDHVFYIGYHSASILEVAVTIEDYTLPNGETEPAYAVELYTDSSDYEPLVAGVDFVQESTTGGGPEVVLFHPDADGVDFNAEYLNVLLHNDLPFTGLLNSIDTIKSEIQSEAGDWVEDVMNAYNAGDVEEMDIRSSYDLVREYSDSDMMTRYTAEMLAVGMDPQRDLNDVVTIDHPDTGEQSGRLFLSWDWSELHEWEYEYDDEAGTLEIDSSSIDDDPDLEVVFADGTETITADDLDDGVADVPTDLGELEAVERYSEGDLRSHIPVGETTDDWNSAIFLAGDGDDVNYVTLDSAEPFELVAVEDEDGNELDSLELSGWENQTRDPTRSLEEAQHLNDQYMTVADLEEIEGSDGIGIPSIGDLGMNAWALILGAAALVAAALASQDGGGGGSVQVHNHDHGNDRDR